MPACVSGCSWARVFAVHEATEAVGGQRGGDGACRGDVGRFTESNDALASD